MGVDKINSSYSTQQILNEKLKESRNEPESKVRKDNQLTHSERLKDSELLLSDDARKLQETEAILRNALHKLEDFDEIREEEFKEIKDKISQGFYQTEQLDEEISRRLFSDDELINMAKQKIESNYYLNRLKEIDKYSQNDVNSEKVAEIKQKIADGFYDRPETLRNVAEELIKTIM